MDYWNSRFKAGKVWGDDPSGTARIASDYFSEYEKKDVLVIGSGYGRNSNYFYKSGFNVDGIEYAKDGIEIARRDNPNIVYYHGSVFDMPFSTKKYSAIYSYNVLHLFMSKERKQLVSLCKDMLDERGMVFFSVFSDEDEAFGVGNKLEDNTFEVKKGKPVHYYSRAELIESFSEYRIIDVGDYTEIVGNKECKLRYIVAQS